MATTQLQIRHIRSLKSVRAGRPCVSGTRIGVDDIVIMHRHLGLSLEQVGAKYQLGPAELHAAMAYYYDHRKVIDRLIAEDDAFFDRGKSSRVSIFERQTRAALPESRANTQTPKARRHLLQRTR